MYKTYVSDAYYQYSKDSDCMEWATDVDKDMPEFESKLVEEHETVEEALESMDDWGSKWVMWPSVYIENEEGEEVYSSYPALSKCGECGKEDWDRFEDGLYTMKNKDGSKLFPEIV